MSEAVCLIFLCLPMSALGVAVRRLLTRDERGGIARNLAKLPEVVPAEEVMIGLVEARSGW